MAGLVARYVTARYTHSHTKLLALHRPERLEIGETYASCFVLFALGIVYVRGRSCASTPRFVFGV
jgi:hypothetical protein